MIRLSRWRAALVAAATLSALTFGWQQLSAQGIAGHDSNAPVNYAADRIELQNRQDRVVLSGNVDITQGALRVRSARMTVAFSQEGSLKINRLDATGGVTVTRNNETARGDVAVYDFNRRVITLVGNVAMRRGTDTLNGGRLVIDLASGVSSVDGSAGGGSPALGGSGGGGRVSGTFSAPKTN